MKKVLIECLKKAGKIQKDNILKIESIKLKDKISSIVTDVDFKCDKVIIDIINKNYPNHNILTEENGFLNKNSNLTWVIDPLDGTSNYAAGLPWFGVLISVLDNETPIISGAYLPTSDQLYFAEKGKGSFLNGDKLTIKEKNLKNSLSAFSTDYTDDIEYLNKGMKIYKFLLNNSRNVRSTNCLLDLLYIPENKYGCCINMFNGIWDIAAPYLLIEEAGGVLKDLDNNDILFEPNANMLNKNYPIVAGSRMIVEDIICKLLVS